MGATTLAGEDRSDPSRSGADAKALEVALRAGFNGGGEGARVEAGRRISLRQRYRRLLRVDACASFTLARFRLDRGTGLRLAPAMGRLHDDAIRTQSRTRRPPRGLSAVRLCVRIATSCSRPMAGASRRPVQIGRAHV